MYARILLALDDSKIADRVLAAAQELAILSGGEVWIVHVWEGDPSVHKSAQSNEEACRMVDAAVARLASAGVLAHGEVAANLLCYAPREIAALAKEHDIDVIVLGSRGRSDLSNALKGSTAHKILHETDRPVVVVK